MMEFRRELTVKPFKEKISIKDQVMLIGSCFTENLGEKLLSNRFKVLYNPSGILFNPISITRSLTSYITNGPLQPETIFRNQEWWNSWDHHSRFTHSDAGGLEQMIREAHTEAHQFLRHAKWLVITLGSAWVYQLDNGEVVANCHKVPTDKFHKKLLAVEDVLSALDNVIHRLRILNPELRIIFTISPVRHLRDGFIENNRSKAVLIQAVHHLVDKFEGLFYFPAYELIIDDLRDYRFYAEDMVHPNYLATDYVWQKFRETCLDNYTQKALEDINVINAARAHKPFQPTSEAHRRFRQKNLATVRQLQQQYPFINWEDDLVFFTGQ